MLKQEDKALVVQTILFVAGLNTLLQSLFGTRLPAIVGGSFTYIIPIAYIINDASLQRIEDPHTVSSHVFCFFPPDRQVLFVVYDTMWCYEKRPHLHQ